MHNRKIHQEKGTRTFSVSAMNLLQWKDETTN